jgi:ABC-type branched-chain amino acid transport systems, periplasmic component
MGLKVKLVGGDTPVEQGPAPAQTLAQKYVGDSSVLVVLGPSTSGAVAASTKTYFAAHIAHISPSATRTDLTKSQGGVLEGTPAFFRDVPGDYIQGPSDANFMIKNLKVKKVVIMDFQEPYSLGLLGGRDGAEGCGRVDDPPVGTQYDDRLLGVRDEGAE